MKLNTTKCVIIRSDSMDEFEKKINKALREFSNMGDDALVDIQYGPVACGHSFYFTAMIIYKTNSTCTCRKPEQLTCEHTD